MQYIITRSLGAPLGRGPALGQNIPLPNVRYVVDFLFWFCFRSCFNLQAKRYIFCCWVKYARMSTVWLNIERASHGCLTWNLPDCLAPASPPWSPEHFEDQSEDSGERPIGAQKLLPGRKRGKGWGLEIPFQYLTKVRHLKIHKDPLCFLLLPFSDLTKTDTNPHNTPFLPSSFLLKRRYN